MRARGSSGGGGGGGGGVRAWREGKTRFARQRLVSREEFRLKIFVVSVVGCVRSARCTVQTLCRSTTARKKRKGILKRDRKQEEKCVIVVRCFYGISSERKERQLVLRQESFPSGSETVRGRTQRNGRRRNGAGARCPVWFVVARQFR